MLDLSEKSILVTGGTGSFGNKFISMVLDRWPKVKRLVVYSRDEQKQFEMAQRFPISKYPCIRFFIGDVRDFTRLKRAMERIDIVIHAAAMKHVPIAEYNPDECVKTNIGGAENVIRACLESNVEKVIALSTDKACAPINLYGATKLVSDKLFIAANNIKGDRPIKFSVVRYGNVMGSNGSVIPFFIKKKETGIIPITDVNMSRFNITLEAGVELVLFALEKSWGGELWVPKIPSYNICTLAKAIAPECRQDVIGIRPGEKIHEEMISASDSFSTYDLGKYYVILPQVPLWSLEKFISENKAIKVVEGFSYNSGQNKEWLEIQKLRELIKQYLYFDFNV